MMIISDGEIIFCLGFYFLLCASFSVLLQFFKISSKTNLTCQKYKNIGC